MTDEKYIPVSEAFYDELETLAVIRQKCEIKFMHDGSAATMHTAITRLFTTENGPYISTTTGLNIRIDRIISVNGFPGSSFC